MQAEKITLGVSVYPEQDNDYLKLEQYIDLCNSLGYSQIFASLHLPEYSLESLIQFAAGLGKIVARTEMKLTADISAHKLREILANKEYVSKIQEVRIDFLRMDYGFQIEDLAKVRDTLNVSGYVLNASTLEDREIEDFLKMFSRLNIGTAQIKACHNFYPRSETGLSMDFMLSRSRQFKKYNIPVTACIASPSNPRGPLYCGLPTVERHRHVSAKRAAMELMATGLVDDILFGDPFVSEHELVGVADVINSGLVTLRVDLGKDISPIERRIVTEQEHLARPDQAEFSIRSQSSREMASFGTIIPPREPHVRQRYAVTIDNEKYSRYSGELQIVLAELPADERVNIVGHIHPQDHGLVKLIRPGSRFSLREAGQC